jgi:hypothetical protein
MLDNRSSSANSGPRPEERGRRSRVSKDGKAGRNALVIGDGGGLWLQCTLGEGGQVRRSWTFRYELNGRRREMGLRPTYTTGLGEAREKAKELRQQLLEGSIRSKRAKPHGAQSWRGQRGP